MTKVFSLRIIFSQGRSRNSWFLLNRYSAQLFDCIEFRVSFIFQILSIGECEKNPEWHSEFCCRYLGIKQVSFGGRRLGDWEEGMTSPEDGYKCFKIWSRQARVHISPLLLYHHHYCQLEKFYPPKMHAWASWTRIQNHHKGHFPVECTLTDLINKCSNITRYVYIWGTDLENWEWAKMSVKENVLPSYLCIYIYIWIMLKDFNSYY